MQLPFIEYQSGDIAGRAFIRENKSQFTRAREVYYVNLDNIEERKDFNVREDYGDIEGLADSIEATQGLVTPITIDVLKTGEINVERGHRRLRAINLLKKRYADKGDIVGFYQVFGRVECFINSTEVTEADRQIALHASNSVKPLSPLESGRLCTRLKENFSLTNQEIKEKTGISRQTVDNHIRLWALPEETKQAIRDGRVSVNEALAGIREASKEEKAAKFSNQIELPGDNRDEKTSSEGKGVGQTIALQKDRALDAETRAAAEEERLFAANSEEQEKLNRAVGNCDWIETNIKKIEDKYPSLVDDIIQRLNWIRSDLAPVKDALIKFQKN